MQAARLRGLRPRRVVLRHALRNALLPTVGIVAINVGYLIGGIFVVETVFAYPGLGRLLVDAVSHRDVPVIQMAALSVRGDLRAGQPGGRPCLRLPRSPDPVLRPRWPPTPEPSPAGPPHLAWPTGPRPRRARVSPGAVLRRQPAVALGAALSGLHLTLAALGPTLAPYGFAQMQVLHTLEAPSARSSWPAPTSSAATT